MDTISKNQRFKVFGMPLYLFAIFAVIVIAASMYDIIPKEITGALAVMFILGIIFGEVGDRIPIWKEYVGGRSNTCFYWFCLLSL